MHFSPCPALGDPDGAEVRGDAAFALWNPEDRPLKFRIGSYLPRDMGSKDPQKANVKFVGADGKAILEQQFPIEHLHGEHGAPEPLATATGKAPVRVQVSGVERWFTIHPIRPRRWCCAAKKEATAGRNSTWNAALRETGISLFQPERKSFRCGSGAGGSTDCMALEINAPDRTVAMIYDRSGERRSRFPPDWTERSRHIRLRCRQR